MVIFWRYSRRWSENRISFIFLFCKKGHVFRRGCRKDKGGIPIFYCAAVSYGNGGIYFLNDNFLPLGYCFPSHRTKIVQLWHGAGAFKKFGLSTEGNEKVRHQVIRANSRITHLFVTSKQVVPYYQEAFAIPESRIFADGIPVTDIYFNEEKKEKARERFYKKYPELEGKKYCFTRQHSGAARRKMLSFPDTFLFRKFMKFWAKAG